jgi:hypothetical protein
MSHLNSEAAVDQCVLNISLYVKESLKLIEVSGFSAELRTKLDQVSYSITNAQDIEPYVLESIFDLCNAIDKKMSTSTPSQMWDIGWRRLDLLMRLAKHPNTPKHVISELVNHRSTLVSYPAKSHPAMANYILFE